MPHKFIAYKGIESELISAIRNNQHEVYYATEIDQDTSEEALCQKANSESYIFLTGDRSLAEDLYDQKKVQSGIMLVDVNEDNMVAKAKVVLDAIDDNGARLSGTYATVTKQRVKLKSITGA